MTKDKETKKALRKQAAQQQAQAPEMTECSGCGKSFPLGQLTDGLCGACGHRLAVRETFGKAEPSTRGTSVVSIRMPSGLMTALRKRAAEETVAQDRRVSINQLVVDILTEAMKTGKKGGK